MTFQEQLEQLTQKAIAQIHCAILSIGEESKHSQIKVLKVDDVDLMFNLPGLSYVTELATDYVWSNDGLQYDYECLPPDQLFQLADHFIQKAGLTPDEPEGKSYLLIGNEAVEAWSEGLDDFTEFVDDMGVWETIEHTGLNSDLPELLQAIEHKSYSFLTKEEYDYINENF